MKITFLPKTHLGKWSVAMMIASWVLFVVGSVLPSKTGYSGLEIIIQNPLQSIITILLLILGIVAFIMAVISVIRKQERSILVFLAIFLGLQSILGFFGMVVNLFFG
ncbi:hypothetical protein [Phosphitispora fastidiosa]|uniref:hypothetical protein n=1 Tax=Phosphitispora fastidiosa TaxID=2837202 RepID=UPI001E51A238|nr:hypothetical protein [Phosphitispora fastidiosa]MBU7006052.1 uncharacterized membrane protein (UPF0182 family) [Phosphitispora fastidiosa]